MGERGVLQGLQRSLEQELKSVGERGGDGIKMFYLGIQRESDHFVWIILCCHCTFLPPFVSISKESEFCEPYPFASFLLRGWVICGDCRGGPSFCPPS